MLDPPRDPNSSLQASLINSNSSRQSQRENSDYSNHSEPRENALRQVQNDEATNFYICSIGLSFLKIIFSSAALFYEKSKCDQPIDTFLVSMRVYDILNGLLCCLRLIPVSLIFNSGELLKRVYRFEAKFKIINVLLIIGNIYYFILFVDANFLYFQPESNCHQLAPTKHTLLVYYIVLTYIFYLGAVGIFCMSFGYPYLCLALDRSRNIPTTEPKRILAKLPVKRYISDLKGDTECSICMNQYKTRDEIVQLQCSEMHYFHQRCIKKWLKINRHCPLCRQTIDKDGSKENYIELERLTIINHQQGDNL